LHGARRTDLLHVRHHGDLFASLAAWRNVVSLSLGRVGFQAVEIVKDTVQHPS
jgi:hypothetical protein